MYLDILYVLIYLKEINIIKVYLGILKRPQILKNLTIFLVIKLARNSLTFCAEFMKKHV